MGGAVRPRLGIVIASVREGRGGAAVAEWCTGVARVHGAFDVEVLDLATIDLPMLREPVTPRLQKYTLESTSAWSRTVAATDAFVFVTPEYNFASPPALVNALDHLYVEWNYKAAAFVSYGGQSGGLRSVQMSKQIVAALKMVPIVEAVALPFYAQQLQDGRFVATEPQVKAATTMLTELARWNGALATLRS